MHDCGPTSPDRRQWRLAELPAGCPPLCGIQFPRAAAILHRDTRFDWPPPFTTFRDPPANSIAVSVSSGGSELSTLLGLFYRRPEELGRFERIAAESLPEPCRALLAHSRHMTVAMENYHRSPVDVRVLETNTSGHRYARRILLVRHSDGRVVQFGIMRLNFDNFSPEVRRDVESQSAPLGRILIQHNVLWQIELTALWKISPGTDLCRLFGIGPRQITYGRTAVIRCGQEPAIELLEIAAPG